MDFLRRYRVALVLCLLLVGLGGAVWYWTRARTASAVTRGRPDPVVGVVSPQRRDIEVKLSFTADILANKQAAIFSKVSGYIRKIYVERGDFVKEGQLLAEIDDQELRASAEQARAALLSSQAGLEVARSTLEGQKANLENQRAMLAKARAVAANDGRQSDRMKTLFEKGMVSAVDWDNARTNADSSRASTKLPQEMREPPGNTIGITNLSLGQNGIMSGLRKSRCQAQPAPNFRIISFRPELALPNMSKPGR